MKVKPKEVMVNLPVVHLFDYEGEDAQLAANFNTFLHGKVRLKYELLGTLGSKLVSIFYLQRNNEFTELREQFMSMIEAEEANLPKLESMGEPPIVEPHPTNCRCEICQWPM